jgi:hypothetical protein
MNVFSITQGNKGLENLKDKESKNQRIKDSKGQR